MAKPTSGFVPRGQIKKIIGKPGILHKATGAKGNIPKSKLRSMASGSGPNAKRAKLILMLNKNKPGWK